MGMASSSNLSQVLIAGKSDLLDQAGWVDITRVVAKE